MNFWFQKLVLFGFVVFFTTSVGAASGATLVIKNVTTKPLSLSLGKSFCMLTTGNVKGVIKPGQMWSGKFKKISDLKCDYILSPSAIIDLDTINSKGKTESVGRVMVKLAPYGIKEVETEPRKHYKMGSKKTDKYLYVEVHDL